MPSGRGLEAGRTGERSALLGNTDSDDELLGGPSGSRRSPTTGNHTDDKVSNIQQQVTGVMQVMQDNINRILERGDRLDDLEERSDNLNVNADHFRRGASQVRRRMWWQNCKMKLIIALIFIAIITIIIVVAVTQSNKSTKQ